MNTIHLTDETLQAFLLKEASDDSIASHLTTCSVCRKKLEDYQQLTTRLQGIKSEPFPFDVTTLVMNTVIQYEHKKSKKYTFVFWSFLMVLFVGISSLSIPFMPKLFILFKSMPILNIALITVTGLAVFLFLLTDSVLDYKTKENKLFKNNLQPTV